MNAPTPAVTIPCALFDIKLKSPLMIPNTRNTAATDNAVGRTGIDFSSFSDPDTSSNSNLILETLVAMKL